MKGEMAATVRADIWKNPMAVETNRVGNSLVCPKYMYKKEQLSPNLAKQIKKKNSGES